MDTQYLDNKIQELSDKFSKLEGENSSLKSQVQELKGILERHQHGEGDGTSILSKNLRLAQDQTLRIADCELLQNIANIGTDSEIDTFAISVGRDPRTGYATSSNNAQVIIVHQSNDPSHISYVAGQRPPLFATTSASTTTGGSTSTITGFTFVVNELAGALINIYDSNGVFQETQKIASNTSTVVTISGTWLNTTSGYALIYFPMYMGISEYAWQRMYVMDDTTGGVRFGGGITNGGQNGLLYMDSTGDLYWRDKGGSSTKLN